MYITDGKKIELDYDDYPQAVEYIEVLLPNYEPENSSSKKIILETLVM